jgi:Tfp pilus assembly protein PilV
MILSLATFATAAVLIAVLVVGVIVVGVAYAITEGYL